MCVLELLSVSSVNVAASTLQYAGVLEARSTESSKRQIGRPCFDSENLLPQLETLESPSSRHSHEAGVRSVTARQKPQMCF